MKFGVFYELQLPRPWTEGSEATLFNDALDQFALADRLGYDYAWVVEHHFLEEYSHSSAPEVFLGAASQRTKNIRLGHGVIQLTTNQPQRVAEKVSTLDLLSRGRVEMGFGEAAGPAELHPFGVRVRDKRDRWEEAVRAIMPMFSREDWEFHGQYHDFPARNVVPKPMQRPHPPVWVACSNRETIKMAARLGIGALTFAFVSPEEAKQWVDDYYRIFKEECVPIGHAVNPNVAMVTGFSCHADEAEARRRGEDGFQFFGYALAHHYIFGEHRPGRTDIWANFERVKASLPPAGADRGIGTPEQLRAHLRGFEAAGVDQVTFIQQAGRNRHAHICEALALFAAEVMPEFHAREAARQAAKAAELAPFIAAAMARKRAMAPLAEADIPTFVALGRKIAEEGKATEQQKANQQRWAKAAEATLKAGG